MFRGLTILSCLVLAGLGLGSRSAKAQQFSADLVSSDATGRPNEQAGKLYVSNRNVRIETPDVPSGYFLVDSEHHAAYFVRPDQHVFMDAKQSSWLTQILVPVDPNNPCPQWQAMAINAGAMGEGGQWHCDRIGGATIAGRDTIKYEAISSQRRQSDAWIDQRLDFPIEIKGEDGKIIDAKNIQNGPQPESLFEIPAGYRKFDPQRLIEQIKQSDVWVEQPK